MSRTVLLVDDELSLRALLKRLISLEGFTVLEAGNLREATALLQKAQVDILICDVKLPDGNGVEFVTTVKQQHEHLPMILLTAYGNIADGVQAMKNGAFDYLVKGDDNDKLIPLLQRAVAMVELQERLAQLNNRLAKQYSFDQVIGESPAIREAIKLARKVAQTDSSVLILGETGTGKEVFAQAIHQSGSRGRRPFVAINCSAFSGELLESELFGYKAGAFTGANKDKKGLLEEAHTGTLFLDEIGEMPLALQAKLLRVLETQQFIKVGDTRPQQADIRIIAATHRDLAAEAAAGRFREDLYYRLNVFTIYLPPLRERTSDIPKLAEFFLLQFNRKLNKQLTGFDPSCWPMLQQHPWKGNIRELKNLVERAVILAEGHQVAPRDLLLPEKIQTTGGILSAFDLASVEKLHIQRVLNHTGGNKTETARLLHIGLTTLYRKIEEYGIKTN